MYQFENVNHEESYVESRVSAFRIDCINQESNTISRLLLKLNKELDQDLSTVSTALSSLNFYLERLSMESLDAELLKNLGILHTQLNYRLSNLSQNEYGYCSIYADSVIRKVLTLKVNLKNYRSNLIERDIKRINESYHYPSVENAEKCLKSVYSLHIVAKGFHLEEFDEELITKLIGVEGLILNHNDYLLKQNTQEAQVLFDQLDKYRAELWSITHSLILKKIKTDSLFVSDEHANAFSFIKNFNTLDKKAFALQFNGCMELLANRKFSIPEIRVFRMLLRGFVANRLDYDQRMRLEEEFGDSIIQSKLYSNGNNNSNGTNHLKAVEFPPEVNGKLKFERTESQILGPDEVFLMKVLNITSTQAVQLLNQERFPNLNFGPPDKSDSANKYNRLIANDVL